MGRGAHPPTPNEYVPLMVHETNPLIVDEKVSLTFIGVERKLIRALTKFD